MARGDCQYCSCAPFCSILAGIYALPLTFVPACTVLVARDHGEPTASKCDEAAHRPTKHSRY